jgi:pyridoxal phosphate enzyme (YggS family)
MPDTLGVSPLTAALAAIKARIAKAAAAAGRNDTAITLVAVSKTHPAAAVQEALACGQLHFGENRVQEAQAKFPALRERHPGLRLHLIGALQTNKAHEAVALADVIESLDRPRLADAIARAADRAGRLPSLLVQVNIGDEPQKAGIPSAEAPAFIEACKARFGTALAGLMCIPPAEGDPAPHFQSLAAMAKAAGLTVLSMGMSADFESAIAHGATHVRIGSAIFGARIFGTGPKLDEAAIPTS